MSTPFRVIVLAFLATRLALFAIGTVAVERMPVNAHEEGGGLHLPRQPHAFLEAWARYDACWYLVIAEKGYRAPVGQKTADMRANFFPLFPALISAVLPVVHEPMLAGLIVSNTSFLIFLVVLWQLVRIDWSASVATKTLWIYLLFPTAFFLSGAYSESVLMAITAGALLAARRGHWGLAGVLAGAATLARFVGVVSIVPVVIEYAVAYRSERSASGDVRLSAADLARVLVPTAVAVTGYLVFAGRTFGNPLATFASQALFRGPIAPPWQPFIDVWSAGISLHSYDTSIIDASLAAVAVLSLPWIYARVRFSYLCYALLIVLIPLSGSLVSFTRMLLPSFPHAILLAQFVDRRRVTTPVLVLFGALEAVAMTAFATWNWVA